MTEAWASMMGIRRQVTSCSCDTALANLRLRVTFRDIGGMRVFTLQILLVSQSEVNNYMIQFGIQNEKFVEVRL
jgi:hypothetical protein